MTVDATGHPIVTGYVGGTATFGVTALTSAGGSDVCVAKLTPAGQWASAVSAGSTSGDVGRGVAVDATDHPVLIGEFAGAAAFGATTLTSTGSGNDVFVARLTVDGQWAWAASAGAVI